MEVSCIVSGLKSFLHLHMAWGLLETHSNQTSDFFSEVAGIEQMALRVKSSPPNLLVQNLIFPTDTRNSWR